MPTLSRAIFGGTTLLTAALALTACTEMGRQMAESEARWRSAHYAAQGNPQFSDPRLQAVVAKFEADYTAIGLDAEKLGFGQGQPCAASPDAAFRTLLGVTPDEYRQMQEEVWRQVPGYTTVVDPSPFVSLRSRAATASRGRKGRRPWQAATGRSPASAATASATSR